jgi:hypothetical protein
VTAPVYVPGQWRHYGRPDGAVFIGTGAIGIVRGIRGNTNDRARKRQRELLRTTGFAGGYAEQGHIVRFELARHGYLPSVANYAGHMCSVGGRFNFQGNWRLARLMGRSLRSAQRYRAILEADGLLTSHTLEAGEMVDGQRAPVSHPQVVRDLSALLAFALRAPRPPPHRRKSSPKRSGPSAAEVPPPPVDRMPKDELRARTAAWLAANPPWMPKRPAAPERVPPGCSAEIDPAEIDEWERDWLEPPERPPDPPD